MAKNKILTVSCFDHEVGKLGFDADLNKSSFQFHPDFLNISRFSQLFPATGILKRSTQTQVFNRFNNPTFRGLPPMFADSLPDVFGNIVFKSWLESNQKNVSQLTPIEQLAYIANRGMGALEYQPRVDIESEPTINLEEIIKVLKQVLDSKKVKGNELNTASLLTLFKIGSSAGGVRPKILIAENKLTGEILPGDLNISMDFNHYIVKLFLDDEITYPRELIEYCYYLTAIQLGINMMPSKVIDGKHFATLRFDRENGKKKHVLTASGLTGWDFQDPSVSSYENLFDLALFLKVPHLQIEELFKRMVFNLVFCNTDDHLKNHSFCYDELNDCWNLAPAYDLTYALNPLLNYKSTSRALSINQKRSNITLEDVLFLAEKFTIKNAKSQMQEIQNGISFLKTSMHEFSIPDFIIDRILKDFQLFI